MTAEVVAGRSIPFGPVLRSRRAMLERRGLIEHGQEIEELVVVRASKPLPMVHGKRSDGVGGSHTGDDRWKSVQKGRGSIESALIGA